MQGQNRKKVFLIDNNAVYREILKHELSIMKELEVISFSSADDALDRMVEKPDMIIYDYNLLPGNRKDGAGLKALTKMLSIDPDLNIVIVSETITKELALQCIANETVSYLSKASCRTEYLRDKVYNELFGPLSQLDLLNQKVV